MIYFCCGEHRRSAVRAFAPNPGEDDINGIDYLEVVDNDEPNLALRQRVLRVFFVKPPGAPLLARLQAIDEADLRITGGERTTGILIEDATFIGPHLQVRVNQRGDFSTYTLRLADAQTGAPLPGMDEALSAIDFSFKAECTSPFDCADDCSCTTKSQPSPPIDYLAKDYESFRQLILDRMSVVAPNWRERNPADLGVTLVELLAYTGDYLSYRQDAAATEAYLGTARQRVSVRRHARMLDYAMHDGCNARAWVQVRVRNTAPATGVRLPKLLVLDSASNWVETDKEPPATSTAPVLRAQFSTTLDVPGVVDDARFNELVDRVRPEVFEAMHSITLFPAHNELSFYTWSDDECCLPQGATRATLAGSYPKLTKGDVLIFKEVLGPNTGSPADADLRHRHAVRLTGVVGGFDKVARQAVTEITWPAEDALPFALCVSSVSDTGKHLADVSVALGNIVLVDHGMTIAAPENLGRVPEPVAALAVVGSAGCQCGDDEPELPPSRFRPRLRGLPLTQAATSVRARVINGQVTYPEYDASGSAASAFRWEMERVRPAIRLADDRKAVWSPARDLLSSAAFAPDFVVEIENNGRAAIRFGDDENGLNPGERTQFHASYRIGNGSPGNVGAEAITQLSAGPLLGHGGFIASVSNPMAAAGGRDPETLEEVRQSAPAAFRVEQRAVTPDDYARLAQRHPEVQRAAATLRWTGSWYTVFLTVDRAGGRPVDAEFEEALREHLERYRMAGHDLEVDGPRYVPIELVMTVCVLPDYFRSDVLAGLRRAFSSGQRADGSPGFFHPDRFTFGQGVHLSELYAAAQSVAGVRHIDITTLQRMGGRSDAALSSGMLSIGRLEIARLDNDPNFRDRGVITFNMSGGR